MSSAAKVELYVSKKPYIKEALAEGIVNFSALARKICREEGLVSEDAVKAALSRYQDYIAESRAERRERVKDILDGTNLEVKPGLEVLREEAENAIISAETSNGLTSVVPGGEKTLISLESPEELEETPGVLEFILSSLAAEGINVDQFISCREDTHLVVEDSDASDALELLRARLS